MTSMLELLDRVLPPQEAALAEDIGRDNRLALPVSPVDRHRVLGRRFVTLAIAGNTNQRLADISKLSARKDCGDIGACARSFHIE